VAVGRLTPERRRQLTRSALVEAAREVFARRGFEGSSLDEIAETAGFTRGAIYKHFKDKEDLFFAVVDDFNEQAFEAYSHLAEPDTGVAPDAGAVATIWKTLLASDPEVLALALEFRLYELRNPSVRRRSAEHAQRTRQAVARFMEDQSARTGIRFRLPPERLAAILLITSDAFSEASQHDPDDADLYETFLELILPAMFEEAPGPGGG
jgi:AcrR family transcriptional regulator